MNESLKLIKRGNRQPAVEYKPRGNHVGFTQKIAKETGLQCLRKKAWI
jgi:hypothetical protein